MCLLHSATGGITTARWNFFHLQRLGDKLPNETIMMAPQYPHILQTALDNTLPGFVPAEGNRRRSLALDPPEESGEPVDGDAIGLVTLRRQDNRQPVFDGNGRAPDISKLKDKQIWVLVNSCMSPLR